MTDKGFWSLGVGAFLFALIFAGVAMAAGFPSAITVSRDQVVKIYWNRGDACNGAVGYVVPSIDSRYQTDAERLEHGPEALSVSYVPKSHSQWFDAAYTASNSIWTNATSLMGRECYYFIGNDAGRPTCTMRCHDGANTYYNIYTIKDRDDLLTEAQEQKIVYDDTLAAAKVLMFLQTCPGVVNNDSATTTGAGDAGTSSVTVDDSTASSVGSSGSVDSSGGSTGSAVSPSSAGSSGNTGSSASSGTSGSVVGSGTSGQKGSATGGATGTVVPLLTNEGHDSLVATVDENAESDLNAKDRGLLGNAPTGLRLWLGFVFGVVWYIPLIFIIAIIIALYLYFRNKRNKR
ncbi:MAG: hypothetical protein V1763_00395 [Parcubacteria group bacterium]